MPPLPQSGAKDAMISRLHLRYTADSFPEDLVLTQTRDRDNWQARYVIQQPFAGTVQQCNDKVAQTDCAAMCKLQISEVQHMQRENRDMLKPEWLLKKESDLNNECQQACREAKSNGLKSALQYYRETLPKRLEKEKKTLADLTGWSTAQIEIMPDAQRYSANAQR